METNSIAIGTPVTSDFGTATSPFLFYGNVIATTDSEVRVRYSDQEIIEFKQANFHQYCQRISEPMLPMQTAGGAAPPLALDTNDMSGEVYTPRLSSNV